MRRFFREVYMDSVFPILNSAELPPYIWGNDEREKVRQLSYCCICAILNHPKKKFVIFIFFFQERLLWILNHCDKRTALESLLSPDRLYKPFNVDRFTLDLSKLTATWHTSTHGFLADYSKRCHKSIRAVQFVKHYLDLTISFWRRTNLMKFECFDINLLFK